MHRVALPSHLPCYITSPETSAAVIPVAIEFMSGPLSSALWASCQVFSKRHARSNMACKSHDCRCCDVCSRGAICRAVLWRAHLCESPCCSQTPIAVAMKTIVNAIEQRRYEFESKLLYDERSWPWLFRVPQQPYRNLSDNPPNDTQRQALPSRPSDPVSSACV